MDDCAEACLNEDSCTYYTHFPDDELCLLYDTCTIEETCDGCFTSEKACADDTVIGRGTKYLSCQTGDFIDTLLNRSC